MGTTDAAPAAGTSDAGFGVGNPCAPVASAAGGCGTTLVAGCSGNTRVSPAPLCSAASSPTPDSAASGRGIGGPCGGVGGVTGGNGTFACASLGFGGFWSSSLATSGLLSNRAPLRCPCVAYIMPEYRPMNGPDPQPADYRARQTTTTARASPEQPGVSAGSDERQPLKSGSTSGSHPPAGNRSLPAARLRRRRRRIRSRHHRSWSWPRTSRPSPPRWLLPRRHGSDSGRCRPG